MNFDSDVNGQNAAANNSESTSSETKAAAFCQNCGKPLTQDTMRVVGPMVFCEPCLAARLSGTAARGPEVPGSGAGETAWQWGAGVPAGFAPKGGPNPGLAALLGLIPGVGAMYNEQYAKGIVHLIVFAVLVSLSHASDLFGLFVFGWVCYMVIEAHHTARARRDGTPLPNPFGLNEVGERLGFGRAWPGSPAGGATGTVGAPPSGTAAYPPPAAGSPSAVGGYATPPPAAWGAPADAYGTGPAAYTASYGEAYGAGYGSAYGATGYGVGYVPPVSAIPPIPPYGGAYTGLPEIPVPPRSSRFPAGAIWLIGLGTIFLLSTTGIFHVFFGWSLVGFVLIGLATWIFLRRMMDAGGSLSNDGTAGYPMRVMRALGPSIWVFTVGVLLLLDAFQIVRWHRSWPVFIILAGVMALLQRAASNSAASAVNYAAAYPAAGYPGHQGSTGYAPEGMGTAGVWPAQPGGAASPAFSASSQSSSHATGASAGVPLQDGSSDATNDTGFHQGGK